MNFSIVILHELLDYLNRSILKFVKSLWLQLLDLLQVVHSNVLVAVGLENFTRNFSPFISLGMDEVTVLTACASIWAMVVSAGNCAEVAWLNHLIHTDNGLLRSELVYLSHLCLSLLIDLLKLIDVFLSQSDQHVRLLAGCRLQDVANPLFLFYLSQTKGYYIKIRGSEKMS